MTPRRLLYLIALLLGVWSVAHLGWMPIVAGDTDLWYHLAHGREILDTGELPTSSHFSFLEPERPFTDYYWLFQVAVAQGFGAAGYTGLVALRAGVFGLFLCALGGALLGRGRSATPRSIPSLLVGFVAFAVSIPLHMERFDLVRPHVVTYTMMAIFLLILERSAREQTVRDDTVRDDTVRDDTASPAAWAPLLLPPLAVIWVNCHGVEYPVLLALVGAYAADLPLEHGVDPRRWSRTVRRRAGALLASALAVLATPHGWKLLPVPFRSTTLAADYIAELQPPSLVERLLLPTRLAAEGSERLANLMVALALVALLMRLARPATLEQPAQSTHSKRIAGSPAGSSIARLGLRARSIPLRPRHLLLFVGFALGLRAARFSHEMALFAIPVLLDAPWGRLRPPRAAATSAATPRRRAFALVGLAAVAALAPALMVRAQWRAAPGDLPLATGNLPLGATAWLRDEFGDAAEPPRLLHSPNPGGWFYQALVPQMRITMDMEVPFLFTDEDMVRVSTAFREPAALHALLTRYRPDAVAAPIDDPAARATLAAFPHLVPVAVDDAVVLFVNRRLHPELASRLALEAVDPYGLAPSDLARSPPAVRAEARRELEALAAREPRVRTVQLALAALARADGRPRDAFVAADLARRTGGDPVPGLELQADALRALGRCDDAVGLYRRIERLEARRAARVVGAPIGEGASVPRSRAWSAAVAGRVQCLLDAGDAEGAYRALDDHVVAPERADAATVFRLGQLAARAGDPVRAADLWRLAHWQTDDPTLIAAIDRALAAAQAGGNASSASDRARSSRTPRR